MNAGLFSVLGFFVILGRISGSDIYPSIHWVPQNPMFLTDGDICVSGPRHLKVQLQSKVHFICPNTATVLQKTVVGVQTANMYENLWIVYNKTAFDKCDTTLKGESKTSKLLLQCNTPTKLSYFPVLFAQFTAEVDGLTFEGGKTYYFIGTSDGTESHINDTSGGHCSDTSNNIYMKIEVYVCKKSNQTYQDPKCQTGVGKLECPGVPTVTPSSSIVTPTPIPKPITTSSDQLSTVETILYSTNSATSEAVCVQTVTSTYSTTVTVSSEVTPSDLMSCADLFNITVSSTDPSTNALLTTEISTHQTVYSTQTVPSTRTVPSTQTVPSTRTVPSTNALFTTEISTHQTVYSTQTVPSIQTVYYTQTVPSSQTVSSTAIPTKTVQASQVAFTEPALSAVIPSKTLPVAVTSTKNVPCAVIFTKTVCPAIASSELCKRCNSKPTQTTVSVSSVNNGSQLFQQQKLSDGQKDSNNEGMWKTVAILFVVLFCLQIVGLIVYITCRTKIFHRYSFKVAPEVRNEDL